MAVGDAIAGDLTCLNCGYNLRGTAAEGTCPECGMAVRASMRADRLADAPRAWRAKLRLGAAWFGAGTLLTLPLLYAGPAIAAGGAWMLTADEPGRAEPMRDRRLRWASRLLLTLGAMILLGLMLASIAALAIDWQNAFAMRWQFVDGAFIAGHVLFWMGLLALGAYLEGLAQRMPDEDLLRRLRRFRRVWLAGMGAGVVLALAANGADYVYRHFNVHYAWTAGVFAGAIFLLLAWLWVETLALAKWLHAALAT